MLPNAVEKVEIEELVKKLKNCEEVSKFLQQEDTVKVSLDLVRAAFDTLITDYPIMKHHLSSNADIVHDKAFDSAVVKVQRGNEVSLTPAEKNAIARFKVDVAAVNDVAEEEESYMDKVRANGMAKKAKKTSYRCLNHVSATSNVVERLFSHAKHVMTDERRCMDPSTLEALLLLRFNRDMWDIYLLDALVLGVRPVQNTGPPLDEQIVERESDDGGADEEEEEDQLVHNVLRGASPFSPW